MFEVNTNLYIMQKKKKKKKKKKIDLYKEIINQKNQ